MNQVRRTILELLFPLFGRGKELIRRLKKTAELIREKKLLSYLRRRRVANNSNIVDPKAQTYFSEDIVKGQHHINLWRGDGSGVVVYTCIVGGYDEPCRPAYWEPNVRYCLITDDRDVLDRLDGRWEVILVKGNGMSDGMLNRYYKFHPEALFENYAFSVYIDGNITPVSDISRFCAVAKSSEVGIAVFGHQFRTSVFEEAEMCKRLSKGRPEKIDGWTNRLESDGFPTNYGLLELPIIFYDMQNPVRQRITTECWRLLIESDCGRDQLVMPYASWLLGYTTHDFGIIGSKLRKSKAFFQSGHKRI